MLPVLLVGVVSPAAQAADPVALERYKRDYLYRDKLQYTVTSGYVGAYGGAVSTQNVFAWAVYDGGGLMLPTEEFMTRVGDTEALKRYRGGRARRTSLGTTLTVAGAGAFAAGIATMFVPVLTDSDDLTPLWIGTGVASLSAIPIGIGAGQFIANKNHKLFVYKSYDVSEADRWIDEHNAALRDELGLELGDVVEVTK